MDDLIDLIRKCADELNLDLAIAENEGAIYVALRNQEVFRFSCRENAKEFLQDLLVELKK